MKIQYYFLCILILATVPLGAMNQDDQYSKFVSEIKSNNTQQINSMIASISYLSSNVEQGAEVLVNCLHKANKSLCDIKSSSGKTPLHYFVRIGSEKIVAMLLLAAAADGQAWELINHPNDDGQKAFTLANPTIRKTMEQYRPKNDNQPEDSFSDREIHGNEDSVFNVRDLETDYWDDYATRLSLPCILF